jgi:hypothetical protein
LRFLQLEQTSFAIAAFAAPQHNQAQEQNILDADLASF